MRFPKVGLGISSEHKNILIGGAVSALTDAVIDHGLARVNALYAVSVKDSANNYVCGIGTGDVANFGIGAGIAWYGKKKHKPKLQQIGFGWMLAQLTSKIAELSGYIQAIDPVYANGEYTVVMPFASRGTAPLRMVPMAAPTRINSNLNLNIRPSGRYNSRPIVSPVPMSSGGVGRYRAIR
jgi:hypothetical protein